MSKHEPITEEARWFTGETKLPTWTILDEAGQPVNVSGAGQLRFLLATGKGQPPLIDKASGAGIAVSGAGSNIVAVTVDDSEYDDVPWGVYYYTLWDVTNDLVLAEGRAVLQQAIAQA